MRDTVGNGPMAESVKEQHAKTTSEFQNLADSRAPPSQSAATGQPLTHYHSFFYNLLSVSIPNLAYAGIIANLNSGTTLVLLPLPSSPPFSSSLHAVIYLHYASFSRLSPMHLAVSYHLSHVSLKDAFSMTDMVPRIIH